MTDSDLRLPTLEQRFRKADNIISRRIAGEAVLVPLRSKAADLDAIYALNETAALVWDLLDGIHTLDQVLDRITAEFEVPRLEAENDLINLVAHFQSVRAVLKVK